MGRELILLSFCLLVVQIFSLNTTSKGTFSFNTTAKIPHQVHHTNVTKEPPVFDYFNFKFDPKAHLMAALTAHKCYVYSMSRQESIAVHQLHGLHIMETKLLHMVDDTTQTYHMMSLHKLNTMSNVLGHACNHTGWKIYKLN